MTAGNLTNEESATGEMQRVDELDEYETLVGGQNSFRTGSGFHHSRIIAY